MRLLAFILSLYVLVLTAIPCCVFDGCEAPALAAKNQPAKQQTPHRNEGCKQCSPFSSCHECAAGFIVIELFRPAGQVHYTAVLPAERPAENLCSCFSASYWQPPRA